MYNETRRWHSTKFLISVVILQLTFPIAQPIKTKLVWGTEKESHKACLNVGISCFHLYLHLLPNTLEHILRKPLI